MLETAVIRRLLQDSGVSALVGTRVTPGRRDQADTLPALCVTWVSGAPEYSDDAESGLASARIEIDCWAKTYGGAKDLAAAVKTSLSGFRGTTNSVTMQNVLLDAERDLNEGGSSQETYPFRTNLDFIFWYEN